MIDTIFSKSRSIKPSYHPSTREDIEAFMEFIELVKRINGKLCREDSLRTQSIQYTLLRDSMAIMDLEAGYRDWQANCIMNLPRSNHSHISSFESDHLHEKLKGFSEDATRAPPLSQISLSDPPTEPIFSALQQYTNSFSDGLECHDWIDEKYRDLRVKRKILEVKCVDAERKTSKAQEQATLDAAEYDRLLHILSKLFPATTVRRQEILKAKVDRAAYDLTQSSLTASRADKAYQLLKEAKATQAGLSVPSVDPSYCPNSSPSSHSHEGHKGRKRKGHKRKGHSVDSKDALTPLPISPRIQKVTDLMLSDVMLKYKLAHFILPSIPPVPKGIWKHVPIPVDKEEEEKENEMQKQMVVIPEPKPSGVSSSPSSPSSSFSSMHSSFSQQGKRRKGFFHPLDALATRFEHRNKHSSNQNEESVVNELVDQGLLQAQKECQTSKKRMDDQARELDDRQGDLAHFWADLVESI
ncbi:MAG: hypothetical protein DHS80DRAFT_21887 [Piptocephalis tieghemiana]|nr:MAG: hypothetical protein DHS80DRAFT_21887 [Piptocephalis tieghemiana]